jgi:hypothetical protein
MMEGIHNKKVVAVAAGVVVARGSIWAPGASGVAFKEVWLKRMGGGSQRRGGVSEMGWGGQSYLQSYILNGSKNRGRFSCFLGVVFVMIGEYA